VIPISKNKDPVRVVAPAPPHLQQRLQTCGWERELSLTPSAARHHAR